ncbi:YetF domain-containing protein [Pseudalkalibacillus hwajinpoensis]
MFDFLIIITLGAVVGADIADPKIEHIHTATTVIAMGEFQRIISSIVLKKRKVGKLITFEPTAVMKNGTFLVGYIKSIRYSIDNILQMLREKDIFDVSEVELAIVKANGNLSVFRQTNKNYVTKEELGIQSKSGGIAYPVVSEGKIYSEVLADLGLSESWLKTKFAEKGVMKLNSIFFASINENQEIHLSDPP